MGRDDDGEGHEEPRPDASAGAPAEPRLASRVLVTWIELTAVGITGGLLGAGIGGPPGFVVYLATTLVSVAVIFHNVNELVKAWVQQAGADANRQ